MTPTDEFGTGIQNIEPQTEALKTALQAVERSYEDDAAWAAAEAAAADEGNAAPLANLYRRALEVPHPKSVLESISKRAAAFFDEWYGDDPDASMGILTTIVSRDAAARWAFDRLTETLTVRERWADLFAAYDAVLSKDLSEERRKELLEEASSIARDIADKPDKALSYLMDLHRIDRNNFQRFRMIERLLERQEQWEDLIELRKGQMPLMEDADAKVAWLSIASCYTARLGNPQSAFAVLKEYLGAHQGDEAGCAELEGILSDESTPFYLKLQTLDLLLENYDSADRKEEAVAAIETALTFADGDAKPSLHRRAGGRLALLDRDEEAIAQYAALLLESPADADALKNLRILSMRAKRLDLRAAALVDAANAAEEDALKITHLLDASRILADDLQDHSAAIRILESVSAIPGIDPNTALTVAHKLNELFAEAGRKEERLGVLAQIFELERTHSLRRTVLVEAARLAEELKDTTRAMDLWHRLLVENENDLEALSAIIDLTEQTGDFDLHVKTLGLRAAGPVLPEQRRADLARAAQVYQEKLDEPALAIDMWKAVFEEFGPRKDAVEALDRLLSDERRFPELDALLERAAGADFEETTAMLFRLADLNLKELKNPERAFAFYYKALVIDPASKRAQEGIFELISRPAVAVQAVGALVWAYQTCDDWQSLLDLTPHRLEHARSDGEQVQVCLEAAHLQKTRADNPEAARDLLTRALPLDPENQQIEAEAVRLAKLHGGWSRTGLALSQAAAAVEDNPPRRAHLKYLEAGILETELGKLEGALSAYQETAAVENRNPEVFISIVRVATSLGKWSDAAEAAVALFALQDAVGETLLGSMRDAAIAMDGITGLTEALEKALLARTHFRVELRRDLEMYIARLYRDGCEDPGRAEAAAGRAVAASRRHAESLQLLADIRRTNKSPLLIETLRALYELKDTDLDPLMEAAQTANEVLSDAEERRAVLLSLFEAGAKLWRLGKKPTGTQSREDCCRFAAWQIAVLDEERGAWQSAADILLSAAELPFAPSTLREMKRKAAALTAQNGMTPQAIDIFMSIWQADRGDVETLTDLNVLLAIDGRYSDLLLVKKKLLDLTQDMNSRISLRIEIAEIAGELTGGSDRIATLTANLDEAPGHAATIEKLDFIMRELRMFDELVQIFSAQATRLAEREEKEIAAMLMIRAAKVLEEHLKDTDRAVAAYEKVVDLIQDPTAMDALARLNASKNRWTHAASWLRMHLTVARPQERVSVLLRLARIQLRLGQNENAIATLEQAFEEAPKHPEIRSLLLEQYRNLENYEALAKVLSRAAAHLSSPSVVLSYTEEAADIYFYKLHVLQKAVAVLERAVALAPEDQRFRMMLAEALVTDGQYERAEQLLTELLESFGRRRSPERGAIHLQLALAAKAQGKNDFAMEQLELASAMDTKNAAAGKALAETARDSGDRDRAERAYRALLLLVRRETQKEGETPVIYPSEILFELSFLSGERDQTEKSEELVESAFEALTGDEAEIARIKVRLEERRTDELLVRVYEKAISLADKASGRAKWYSLLSDIYLKDESKKEAALKMRLSAVSEDPGNPDHHNAAESLAKDLGMFDAYIKIIEGLIQKARREDDELKRCELLLRLGNVYADKGDLDAAWECFEQVENLQVREVDILKFGAKLAGKRGDEKAQVRMLSALSNMGEDVETETRADAMYRLAEIYLAAPDSQAEGAQIFEQAFAADPKCIRAGRILVRACRRGTADSRLLSVFERVARQSEDHSLLLEYLEQRAQLPNATATEIREAAALALQMKEDDKAETLMKMMSTARAERPEDKEAVLWAVLNSAERRKAEGDLEGALSWIKEAVELSTPAQIFDQGLEIAALAAAAKDGLPLAIKTYKWLLEFDPSAPRAWRPLSAIYLTKGDILGFEALVQETLYTIESPIVRNEMRLMFAKLLLSSEKRRDDALEVLMNIQLDEPEHAESLFLIAQYYETSGRTEELIELLKDRFQAARAKRNIDELKTLALELAPKIQDTDTEEAVALYRDALEFVPDDTELLHRLLSILRGDDHAAERAQIREKMLVSLPDDSVAEVALRIVEEYRVLEDPKSAHRVLRSAYQRVPDDGALKSALEDSFRENNDYRGLADLLQKTVASITDLEKRARVYCEIGDIARDRLLDPSMEIEALRQAYKANPADTALILRLLESLVGTNRNEEAMQLSTSALDQFEDPSCRCALLNFRGNLLCRAGDLDGGVSDLRDAFAITPAVAAENLEKALVALRDQLKIDGNLENEKTVVFQLYDVLDHGGKKDEMRDLLRDWLVRDPHDINSWKRLMKLESDATRWDKVAEICEHLINITEGEEQLKAAVWLSQACAVSERLEAAQHGLEIVYAKNPSNENLRAELKKVYEKIGAEGSLAAMLVEDAAAATDDAERAKLLKKAGTSYMAAGDTETALSVLTEAMALTPEDFETALSLIDAYIDRGELDMANALTDQAIAAQGGRRSKELSTLQQRKAVIMGAYGDQSQQLSWLEQAFVSNRNDGEIAAVLADLAETMEEWDLALKALRQITMLKEDAPISKAQAYFRQGKISYFREEDKKRAVLFVKKALQEDPAFEEARQFLAEVDEV